MSPTEAKWQIPKYPEPTAALARRASANIIRRLRKLRACRMGWTAPAYVRQLLHDYGAGSVTGARTPPNQSLPWTQGWA